MACENKNEIHKGDKFLCIKDVLMVGFSSYVAYDKDKVYISEREGCITDKSGNKNHFWYFDPVTTNPYFEKIV